MTGVVVAASTALGRFKFEGAEAVIRRARRTSVADTERRAIGAVRFVGAILAFMLQEAITLDSARALSVASTLDHNHRPVVTIVRVPWALLTETLRRAKSDLVLLGGATPVKMTNGV